MTLKRQCDRCGALADASDEDGDSVGAIFASHNPYEELAALDLCRACHIAVVTFLRTPPRGTFAGGSDL